MSISQPKVAIQFHKNPAEQDPIMKRFEIEIIHPLATQLLYDLAALDLIRINAVEHDDESIEDLDSVSQKKLSAVKALAGSWSSMSESDFDEYLSVARNTFR